MPHARPQTTGFPPPPIYVHKSMFSRGGYIVRIMGGLMSLVVWGIVLVDKIQDAT